MASASAMAHLLSPPCRPIARISQEGVLFGGKVDLTPNGGRGGGVSFGKNVDLCTVPYRTFGPRGGGIRTPQTPPPPPPATGLTILCMLLCFLCLCLQLSTKKRQSKTLSILIRHSCGILRQRRRVICQTPAVSMHDGYTGTCGSWFTDS